MTKIKITLLILSLGYFFSTYAQYKESENILNRLVWDDKMMNVLIDSRTDLQSIFSKDSLESAGFRAQTFRFLISGEIIPGFRYQIRHRFNKPQTPLIRDNYSSATDQAWLAFDINSHWTITAGKQSVALGTFEYDYNGADTYLVTMVDGDFDLYKTGAAVKYMLKDQALTLQVVNSDNPQFASEEYKNKAFAVNVLWQGSFLKEMIKTRYGIASYQHDKDKFYNWLTLGTQLNISKATAEFDYYLGNRMMDYSSIVDDPDLGERYVKDQSMAVNLYYDFGKWKPFLKGTWNQRKDKKFDAVAYDSKGVQAAIEFYPFDNKYLSGLRFHAAYIYQTTDFKNNFKHLSNADTHTILGGMRWLLKVK